MSKKELVDNINIEIENLERLNKEMIDLLAKTKKRLTFIETRAAASILHDFYCGVEKIFEKIALSIDKKLPKGEDWHIELVSQMTKPFASVRKSVISKTLFQKLKEYLKFRHLFRNIYGFELKWERFESLCIGLENILKELTFELEKFISGFEEKS